MSVGYTVLYSWQSDTPANANRSLIRDALDAAVATLGAVQEAPRVDTGMEGVAGSPEVATVMFEKIRESGIMVADLTLVGRIQRHDGEFRRAPNPNVLLELGYAAAALGWGRVIGVMNEHFGLAREQPFDVRNRRFPIQYKLDPANASDRKTTLSRLTNDLADAIRAVAEADYREAELVTARLDTNSRAFITTYSDRDKITEPAANTYVLGSGSGLDTPRLLAAIARLLDLGVIRAVYDSPTCSYIYEWTYLGRAVATRLGA